MMKVAFGRTLLLALLAALSAAGLGQEFPTRPIRIVTAQVGGGADFAARLLASGVSGPLGQQVIVDNRPAGVIPGEIVSRAPADGYTLLVAGNSLYLTPLLQANVPYDAIRDFAPVASLVISPTFLVIHADVPAKSVNDLISLAKARPGHLNYSEGGTGGTPHLAAELFKYMAGVNFTRVTYSGGGPALTAVIAGEVQVTFASGGAAAPLIKSNKLRPLAVTTAKPSALFPELPTVATTVPGYEAIQMTGAWAPAHTPPLILGRLNREFVRAVNAADTRKRFLDSGQEIATNSREEFAVQIKAELARMGRVIKAANIRSN